MNVFMTSATGHVGSAVADLLVEAGHSVSALVRSVKGVEQLEARGITPWKGDLRSSESFVDFAVSHESILHTAYAYAPEGNELPKVDESAVAAMLAASAGSPAVRQFVYTSSVFLLGGSDHRPLDEETPSEDAHPQSQRRLQLESRVLRSSGEHLTTAVVRLGVVYGANSYSMSELFETAREGSVVCFGTGTERWPLVYRGDVASLFRAVVERRGAGIFHAVDGTPMATARIAELASLVAGCGGRTHTLDDQTARATYGEHYDRVLRDVPAVSSRGATVGWQPSVSSFEDGAAIAFEEWQSHPAREEATPS